MKRDYTLDLMGRGVLVAALGKTQMSCSRGAGKFMMEDYQLAGAKRARGVSAPFVVAEFDFKYIRRESFYHGTNLAALQVARRQILQERHDDEWLNLFHRTYLTARSNSAGAVKPRPPI